MIRNYNMLALTLVVALGLQDGLNAAFLRNLYGKMSVAANAASHMRRGLSAVIRRVTSKKLFTKIGAATLLSGAVVATTQKSNDDTRYPLTEAVMSSLWNSQEFPHNDATLQSGEPRIGKFHDVQTGTRLTITPDKDKENCCVIDLESSNKVTIKDVQSKPKFWLRLARVATFEFDFKKLPKPNGTPGTFGIEDSYTRCEGSITFLDNTKTPDTLKVETRLECTTKLLREQYFNFLNRLQEEDERDSIK